MGELGQVKSLVGTFTPVSPPLVEHNMVPLWSGSTKPASPICTSITPPIPTYLAVVDTNDRTNHLGHHDHVTQVRPDHRRLLVRRRLLLGLAQLLDESHRAALQATLEAPTRTRVHQLDELLVGHVQQLVKLHAAVGKLAEGALALQLGSGSSVVVIPRAQSVPAHQQAEGEQTRPCCTYIFDELDVWTEETAAARRFKGGAAGDVTCLYVVLVYHVTPFACTIRQAAAVAGFFTHPSTWLLGLLGER